MKKKLFIYFLISYLLHNSKNATPTEKELKLCNKVKPFSRKTLIPGKNCRLFKIYVSNEKNTE